MPTHPSCAERSADSGEPMLGTAPRVDVWIILTHRATWRAKALKDNALPPPVRDWLDAQVAKFAAAGLKARPQFARQSGQGAVAGVTLFVACGGELWRFDAEDERELPSLDLTSESALAARCRRVREPQYFVCTNGQRDVCCSRFGLPVYARLRDLVAERAWQTTHVGGHRFAANVLALPQGVLYGRLKPDAVVGFLAAVEAGRLAKAHLRGRSAFPGEAQAAEALLDEPAVEVLACEAGRVVLRGASGRHVAAVTPAATAGVLASCGDDALQEAVAYRASRLDAAEA